MPFLQLTLLSCLLIFFAGDQASEAEATDIILQSTDGGQTWQDISPGFPETGQLKGFFVGPSEVYLRTANGVTYRSKSNLKTPVWEKENFPDLRSTSIAFNRSGVIAYSYDGHVYQKKSSSETWLPIYTSLIDHTVSTIFEASDGTVFRGKGNGLSKSDDKGRSWKVNHKGHVGEIVESEGVLLATGEKGIMRSTDYGEHWERVISEGWVGITVEVIDGGFAAITRDGTQSRIRTSFDGGKTWQAIDEGLQPSLNIWSVKQMGSDLFVGHPDGIFRSSDMGKTWHRVHAALGNMLSKFVSLNSAPAREKVFILYVSGNVLYAMASSPGC